MVTVVLSVTLLWARLVPGVRVPGGRGRGATRPRWGWSIWLVKLIEILEHLILQSTKSVIV